MSHHLLNLLSQTTNTGSPNNNENDIPDVYERPIHIGNRPLLFSSGITNKNRTIPQKSKIQSNKITDLNMQKEHYNQAATDLRTYLEMNPKVLTPGLAGCIKYKHKGNY